MIADEVNMNRETVRLILTAGLEIKKIVPRWCPGNPQSNNGMRG
jgi:hypothetical protein